MPKQAAKFIPKWIIKRDDQQRDIDNSLFYNSTKWRKFSRLYKDKNPLCVKCKSKGIVSSAYVADHIKPIILGGEKFNLNNIQSLCNHHHNSKSGLEGASKQRRDRG